MNRFAACWVLAATIGFASMAVAEPIAEAEDAYRKRDFAGVIRILDEAAVGGNIAAKGRLASFLRGLPPPYGDVERGCQLAREAAESGDASGLMTRAECLIVGTEKNEHQFAAARELARKAMASGYAYAGATLFTAFGADPQYSYLKDGKADMTKYFALAATPVSARGDQVEAYNGLADAMRAGQVNALLMALAYLAQSSAPGNVDRILNLAGMVQQNGVPVPEKLDVFIRVGRQIKQLGTTHTSVHAFNNAYVGMLGAVAVRFRQVSANCDPKEVRLVSVKADAVENAEYLPISKVPLTNTYLVRGTWNEAWTYTGCGQTFVVPVGFAADGWGGAHYLMNPSPKPAMK